MACSFPIQGGFMCARCWPRFISEIQKALLKLKKKPRLK